jgi:methionine sulfoxide reductase heme-binding subunit
MPTLTMMVSIRWGIWISGAIPAALLFWLWQTKKLGLVPVEALLHQTGRIALLLLIGTLGLGFVQHFIHWKPLFAVRRPLGVWAFIYGCAHAATWFWLDQSGLAEIALAEVTTMAHVQLGLAVLLLLLPLALTSVDIAPRILGYHIWKKLHLLVWPAACLAIFHVWVVSRFESLQLVGITLLIVLLMGARSYVALKRKV